MLTGCCWLVLISDLGSYALLVFSGTFLVVKLQGGMGVGGGTCICGIVSPRIAHRLESPFHSCLDGRRDLPSGPPCLLLPASETNSTAYPYIRASSGKGWTEKAKMQRLCMWDDLVA